MTESTTVNAYWLADPEKRKYFRMMKKHLHPWWRRSRVTQNTIILSLSFIGKLAAISVSEYHDSYRADRHTHLIGYDILYNQSISCHTCLVLVYVKCSTSLSHALTKLFDVFTDSHLLEFKTSFNICSQPDQVQNPTLLNCNILFILHAFITISKQNQDRAHIQTTI